MQYSYPLTLKFRLIAFAPKISVTDADNKEILYIEQKVFALKESVKVYNNSKEKKLLFTIKANQLIDFGATYVFRDAHEKEIGSIQQQGIRSLFQASYTALDAKKQPTMQIIQKNPLIGLLDSLISLIPFGEFLNGFILNPTYEITMKDTGKPVMQMKKKPSFFEASFTITPLEENLVKNDEQLCILATLMIVQLERNRS